MADDDVTPPSPEPGPPSPPPGFALTILCHPNPERVGEVFVWVEGAVELSRLEPEFSPQNKGSQGPLSHRQISRRPIRLVPQREGSVEISKGDFSRSLFVNLERVSDRRVCSAEEVRAGAVLLLARTVALVLHRDQANSNQAHTDFVGGNLAIRALRERIKQVADLDDPVLILGETGTGKELVAEAIWKKGRFEKPYRALNLAALSKELMEAELYGCAKGSHSGASFARPGLLREVRGGTVFFDEIGDADPRIQTGLLRFLQSGEIQPLGEAVQTVEVRILAATDRPLQQLMAQDKFREALVQRFPLTLELPALRERRDDIGRLFFYFLEESFKKFRQPLLNEEDFPGRCGELPKYLCEMALHPWPGNVRQLRSVVGELALASQGLPHLVCPELPKITASIDPPKPPGPPPSLEELRRAIRQGQGNMVRIAKILRVGRTTLYKLGMKRVKYVPCEEILQCYRLCNEDLLEMCAELLVSKHGLSGRLALCLQLEKEEKTIQEGFQQG